MSKKTYAKPKVVRFRLRPEDAVVAACKEGGNVACEPGGVFVKESGS